MTLADILRQRIKSIPAIIKDAMQRTGIEIEASIDDYMQADSGSPADRLKEGRTPNTTNKLRVVSGALRSAFVKGRPGYASAFNIDSPTRYGWVVGIDLDVIPYARIHELGGVAGRGAQIPARPYIAPALKDYSQFGMDDLTRRIMKKLLDF